MKDVSRRLPIVQRDETTRKDATLDITPSTILPKIAMNATAGSDWLHPSKIKGQILRHIRWHPLFKQPDVALHSEALSTQQNGIACTRLERDLYR